MSILSLSDARPRSVLAIVQARVGATRLPGKVLADLEGSPVLAHVLRRVNAAESITHRVLAIPDTAENDVLAAIGVSEGFDVYRGSESDVLSRFWWASQLYPDDKTIVRVTGEDVCKDPALIDLAVGMFLDLWENPTHESPHYLNIGGPTWPVGLDVEVFSRGALNAAHQRATDPLDREHVTTFIQREGTSWTMRDPHQRSSMALRLTIDSAEDLEFMRAIYAKCYKANNLFGYDEMLAAIG